MSSVCDSLDLAALDGLDGLELPDVLTMDVGELLADRAIDHQRDHKALRVVKDFHRMKAWHHYGRAGLHTYARWKMIEKPAEWKARFLEWKREPDEALTREMAAEITTELVNRHTVDVVTTTPRSAERGEGYHPSEALARAVAAGIGKPYRTLFAPRTRHRPKGFYASADGGEPVALAQPIRGAFVLLVDDAVMSGNSLHECSSLLRANGNDVEAVAYLIYG